jgi:hypothetical protein
MSWWICYFALLTEVLLLLGHLERREVRLVRSVACRQRS